LNATLPHTNDAAWEPIWTACEELDVPICFQAGTAERVQLAPHPSYSPTLAEALRAMTRPVSTVFVMVNMLMSRILLNHPGLRVVFAESGIAWAAYLLEYADHQFTKDLLFRSYELTPSEMFRRQCCLTAWYEDMSLETRGFIGTENIAWSTNFPLATSTWPNTKTMLARWAHRVPADERALMLWGNTARFLGLDVKLAEPSPV
jgi:predicted TIM-barrel fold metal-dependent hydrolase